MTFQSLNLIEPITQALVKKGYLKPTPIQLQSIPYILEGKDIFGCAQTGTGKTAAFALPILNMMFNNRSNQKPGIKALILAPTRELAIQISESFSDYGTNLGLKHAVLVGGVSQVPQVKALRRGVDILIATPGRLTDLMQQGIVDLRNIEYFVLDEADRMLDMGFIHDIKRIIAKLPLKKQTLFFSATVAPEIKKLASSLQKNPVMVGSTPESSTSGNVKQSVYHVNNGDKVALLSHIIQTEGIDNTLVFTRTKRGADRVAKELNKRGINAEAIHGNKSQNARQRALQGFKSKSLRVLVATDIASRGIDVDKLSHVINYEIPNEPEVYVHRIGRTGRAGEAGIAYSFCSPDEASYMNSITRLIKMKPELVTEHPYAGRKAEERRPVPQRMQGNDGRNNKKSFRRRESSAGMRAGY